MTKRTLLSWSSGKDCAWALHVLQQDPQVDVVGLFCTVNKAFDRVAMHGVRTALLRQQAASVGLELHLMEIPYPCSNRDYVTALTAFVNQAKDDGIECFAYGDLFLESVRRYRENKLKDSGISALFPLWGIPTQQLCHTMVANGLRAVITCLDPKKLPRELAGKEYDDAFLSALPADVDPCGERGEFHSFAFAGPMFKHPIAISMGETVERDGFVFTDFLPATT